MGSEKTSYMATMDKIIKKIVPKISHLHWVTNLSCDENYEGSQDGQIYAGTFENNYINLITNWPGIESRKPNQINIPPIL